MPLRLLFVTLWLLLGVAGPACLVPPPPGLGKKDGLAAPLKSPAELEEPPFSRIGGRLPVTVHPLHYALDLEIDPRETRFSGQATIDVSVPRTTAIVVLHAGDLSIRSIVAEVGSDVIQGTPTRHRRLEQTHDELMIRLARQMPAGTARITIAYDAPFVSGDDPRGLFRRKGAAGWSAFTNFEPSGARAMFPSFDEPAFKTPFDVTVTVPTGMLAIGNMPEVSRARVKGGTQFRFATTPPLPTYVVSIAVGEFDVVEGPPSTVPLRLIRPVGTPGAPGLPLQAAAAFLPIMADLVGYPYPFPKLDLVGVTPPFLGAMENPGLITCNADLLLRDPARSSVSTQRDLVEILAHEIAHQWAGDLVTPRWWDDIWLNEGFATFLAPRATDRWRASFSAERAQRAEIHQTIDFDTPESDRPIRWPIYTVNDAERIVHSGVEYSKGAAVLGMLERFVGPDAFHRGLARYLRENAWKSVTTDDFVAALEAESGKALTSVVTTFTSRAGVPGLSIERTCNDDGRLSIAVTQEPGQTPWAIPFCISAQPGENLCAMVGAGRETIAFEASAANCRSWIDPNPGLAGYYRYDVTEQDLELARPISARLAPAAKLGLLSNAWASVRRRHLKPNAILRFLPALDTETDGEVMFEIMRILGAARPFVRPETEDLFRAYVMARFLPHKGSLGLAAANDRGPLRGRAAGEGYEIVRARQAVLWGLTLAHDKDVVTRAKASLFEWLDDPTKVDPDIDNVVPILAGKALDAALFERVREQVERPTRPENRNLAVRALGAVDDPALTRRALDLTLRIDLSGGELSTLLWVAASSRNRDLVFEWIASEWTRIASKWQGDALWPVLQVAQLACEDAQRKAFETIRSDLPTRQVEWLTKYLRDGVRCHEWVEYGRDSFEAYLRAMGSRKPR